MSNSNMFKAFRITAEALEHGDYSEWEEGDVVVCFAEFNDPFGKVVCADNTTCGVLESPYLEEVEFPGDMRFAIHTDDDPDSIPRQGEVVLVTSPAGSIEGSPGYCGVMRVGGLSSPMAFS